MQARTRLEMEKDVIRTPSRSGDMHEQYLNRSPEAQPNKARPYKFRPPSSDRTSFLAWATAVICALLWAVVILVGLAILVVYLVFRPRSPHVEISSASLNAAYLDSDPTFGTTNLLNADLTLLLNFSNPNKKVRLSITYVAVDLFFGGNFIAAQGVDPFAKGMAATGGLRTVHLLSSEVPLSVSAAQEWQRQLNAGGVYLEVDGKLRTRSEFVGLLKFKYWLHTRCRILMSAPPSGVLVSSQCRTKR